MTYNPVAPFDLTNKFYVDTEMSATSVSTITSADANYLKTSKGTLTGVIDMADNKIISTYVPVSAFDFVNKQYVDSVNQAQAIGSKKMSEK